MYVQNLPAAVSHDNNATSSKPLYSFIFSIFVAACTCSLCVNTPTGELKKNIMGENPDEYVVISLDAQLCTRLFGSPHMIMQNCVQWSRI